jgi:GTPase SAR1 family protein
MKIGLLGNAHSGKNTAANHLINKYNYLEDSFARILKKIIKCLFNFTEDQVNGQLKEVMDKRWNITPRQAMQFIGTELFRNQINKLIPDIGNNFWIKSLDINMNKKKDIVITDVRFQNEVDYMHSINGIVIKIVRSYNSENKLYDHESEKNIKFIKNYDYLIENNGTKQDLYKKIDEIILDVNRCKKT